MLDINYLKGDATKPNIDENKIIVHVCNDIGGWGKGFVLALSKRWKEPEKEYRQWYKNKDNFILGEVQFAEVESDIIVANMIAQHDIIDNKGKIPLRYEALLKCLETVSDYAIKNNSSIHMPRIGCGLAGGKWELVENIIKKTLCEKDIAVYVYDFE